MVCVGNLSSCEFQSRIDRASVVILTIYVITHGYFT